MTPAAPLVGAVTTFPKEAFSSFTASAKQLTQSRYILKILSSRSDCIHPSSVICYKFSPPVSFLFRCCRPSVYLKTARQNTFGVTTVIHAFPHHLPDRFQLFPDLRFFPPDLFIFKNYFVNWQARFSCTSAAGRQPYRLGKEAV